VSTTTDNKRGPNIKKREITKRKLIDSVITLLEHKNADEITINDITSNGAVALGTFYNYFQSKTEITHKTAEHLNLELFSQVEAHLDENQTAP